MNKGAGVAEAWESNPVLRALRLNKLEGLVEHKELKSAKADRRTCALSCTHCEALAREGTPHPGVRDGTKRLGFPTQSYCETCEVYLSTQSRVSLSGHSAFEEWHSRIELRVHPYVVDEAQAAESSAPRSRPSPSTDSGLKRRRPVSAALDASVSVSALNLDQDDQ